MKNLLFLSFGFLLCSLPSWSFAQKNWRSATVLTIGGAELQGEIDYGNWDINPERLEFRRPDGELSVFDENEVKRVEIVRNDGFTEAYQRFVLPVESSPVKLSELTETADPVWKTDTAWLLEVVRGPVSLYYLKDKRSVQHFFLQKEDGEPEELVYKKYRPTADNDIATYERFRQTLKRTFSECRLVWSRIDNMQYGMSAMRKLITAYYETCENEPPAYIYRPEKKKWNLYLAGGLTSNKITFEGREALNLEAKDFERSIGWTAGVGVDVPVLRSNDRLSAIGELVFRNYDFSWERTEEEEFRTTYERVTFDFLVVRPTIGIRYYALLRPVKVYVNLGMGYEFLINEKENQYYKQIDSNLSFFEDEKKALDPIRKHQQLFWGGVGTSFGRFGAEFRWQTGNGFSTATAPAADQQSWVLLLKVNLTNS